MLPAMRDGITFVMGLNRFGGEQAAIAQFGEEREQPAFAGERRTQVFLRQLVFSPFEGSPRTQQVTVGEVKVAVHDLKPADVTVVPAEERSNWARKIAKGEFVTTVEVLPPKGCDPWKTLDAIRLLKDAGVDGVNIPDGPRAQTRMGAMATANFLAVTSRRNVQFIV